MNKFQILLAAVCGLILLASSGYAQASGGIRGIVYDKDFNAPLSQAEITVAETGQKVTASEEGNYVISGLEPGTYTLVVAKEGYTRKVFADVVVPAGSMTDQDAQLAGEFTDMEEFVVQDLNMGGSSEEGLLNLRMEAPALMDSVGADLMSQAGASDAASALKLVSGTTVQDGKYAVVRGLPDRYVNSQMNGVRLPTADPDKRAVQLDQFPSAMIESVQVTKTFTPDQQGDASGGAVNVVLKGIPDEAVLKLSVGTKYKTNVNGKDFLTYEDGGVGTLGLEADQHDPQVPGDYWDGAVGVQKGDVPEMYDWSLTAGGSKNIFNDWKIGGLANAYYKRSASSYDDGISDKYYNHNTYGMVPYGLVGSDEVGWSQDENEDEAITSLFDVQKSSEEIQWGWLGAVGIENERNKLKMLHMRTHVAESSATLAEDTRGHDEYFEDIGYRRAQTLEYVERDTETLQVSGEHTIPFPEIGIPGFLTILEPEVDWTGAKSSSSLDSPDRRTFSSLWSDEQAGSMVYIPGYGWFGTPDTPAQYEGYNRDPQLANFERVWTKITEESDQYFINGKFPFEQWTGDKGYLKFGLFNDEVERSFSQKNYSPSVAQLENWEGDWSEYWSDYYNYRIYESPYGASYQAEQQISAWYWMADVPLSSFFKVVGGTRYEKTILDVEFQADDETRWWDREENTAYYLSSENHQPDVGVNQKDILPSLGFEFTPLGDQLVLRANYSQTIARPTFKEMSPVATYEYAGADPFIGNPELEMSSLKNYDLRADWTPYEGALVSVSWFKKDIENPIEYTQDWSEFFKDFTTAANYPEGTLSGYEFEVRQHLGQFVDSLNGLSVGGNLTVIDAQVTISDEDISYYYDTNGNMKFGFIETSRDMVNTPDYLYNLFTTYDIKKTGTKLGLFYTVTGDTLVAGPSNRGYTYVPGVYAKEYGTLNFSLSQKIGENWTLGFKAKNLLNPEIQEVYRSDYVEGGDVLKTSYTKGMEFSVSLSCEF